MENAIANSETKFGVGGDIPRTGTRTHLDSNLAAAAIRRDEDEIQAITEGMANRRLHKERHRSVQAPD